MPRHSGLLRNYPTLQGYAMCGVVLGTALQLQQSNLFAQAVYMAAVFAAVMGSVLSLRYSFAGNKLVAVLLGASLAWGMAGWRAVAFDAQALSPQWEGVDLRVVGVITDTPQLLERGVRLRLKVESARTEKIPLQAVDLPQHVALTWYTPLPHEGLHAGQRWEWTVRLKVPNSPRNPYGRDGELRSWNENIQASGYVRASAKNEAPKYLGTTPRIWWPQWRGQILERMQEQQTKSNASAAAWGVVQALVTGAQSRISLADWQLFRDTGVAHLVSISGLHITMFAWLAMTVVNFAWRRFSCLCLWCPAPIVGAWAGLALAVAYALLSGWAIPAQRTIGMLSLAVWLRSQGKSWPWPYVWLVILTVVLLADPWSLLQAGFWLSFVAVGVLFATHQLAPSRSNAGWQGAAKRMVREQAAVSVALAPLTVVLFGQVSVVGLIANLWAIPWVTLVVAPLSMLGMLLPVLWDWAAYCVTAMTVGTWCDGSMACSGAPFCPPCMVGGWCCGDWWVVGCYTFRLALALYGLALAAASTFVAPTESR